MLVEMTSQETIADETEYTKNSWDCLPEKPFDNQRQVLLTAVDGCLQCSATIKRESTASQSADTRRKSKEQAMFAFVQLGTP